MSIVVDAMQPFLVAGLPTVEGRPKAVSISDLIGKQRTDGFDLDFDNHTEEIVTDFRESAAILNSVAFDSSRFASAAFQTIVNLPVDITYKDRTAWSVIQAYYAAFYAGHSILRLLGESCSYFDRSHINRIAGLANAIGKVPGFTLKSTAYHCLLDATATVIRSASLRDGTGGAHEAFWKVFGLRLKDINGKILVGTMGEIERQIVFDKLETFRENICADNAPFFSSLSVIRNNIQYRHGMDVWLPSSLRKADRQQLGRLLAQWTRDPITIDLDIHTGGILGRFSVTCAFLISVCKHLLARIAERAPSARSFARLGPLLLV
jgi:hypothetical protein